MSEHENQEQSAVRLAWQLVSRLESDTSFLASLLVVLRRTENLSDRDVANALGIAIDQLPRFALCRVPRDDFFREDINEIADRFSLDADTLARLVREAQALQAFTSSSSPDLLAAARDHIADEPGKYHPWQKQPSPESPSLDRDRPSGEISDKPRGEK